MRHAGLLAVCSAVVSGLAALLAAGSAQAAAIPVPNGDLSAGTGLINAFTQPSQFWIDYNTVPGWAPGNGGITAGTGPGGLNSMNLWAGYNYGNNSPPTPYPGVNMNIWTVGNAEQALTVAGAQYQATVAVGEFSGDGAGGLGVPAPTFRIALVDVIPGPWTPGKYTTVVTSAPFTPAASGTWTDISSLVYTAPLPGHGLEINLYIDGFYGINGTSWGTTQAQVANFRLSEVPEPTSLMVLVTGTVGVLAGVRPRRRASL